MSASRSSLSLTLVLLLGACGTTREVPPGGPDATSAADARAPDGSALDAGLPDSGPSPEDAQAGDATGARDAATRDAATPDATAPRDAAVAPDAISVDGSLSGTPLEGLPVEFSQTLQLCDQWAEGGTLEEGRARQVRLVLPPHARSSLEPAVLATARIDQGLVQTDAYSTGTWVLEDQVARSSLSAWTLSGGASDATLQATVTHALGGAGLLTEHLYVRRATGDRRPVRYTAEPPAEVTFVLVRPDGTQSFLGPCGGEARLENAIVVSAFSAGSDVLTVLREQRTRPAPAGSAPVYPIQALAQLRRPAGAVVQDVRSFFAQTYTAQHHNWQEHSRLDFTRDRRWSYFVFEPLARGAPVSYPPEAFERIEVIGLGSSGVPNARAEATWVDTVSGARTMQTYPALLDWRRVDDVDLARDSDLRGCAATEIIPFYDFSSTRLERFVVAGCVGAGPLGFDARLFVPVVFPIAPELTGARFGASAIQPISGGIRVDLGSYRVELSGATGGRTVRLLSSQGSELSRTTAYEYPLFDEQFGGQHHDAATADGSVRAILDLEWLMQGAGSSSIFGPADFSLTFGGRTHRVPAWDKLLYTNTHHNWDDTLVAETPDLRLFWRVLGFGGNVTVRAERLSDGQVVLPETMLTQ
ncbi:MAG: hypothetical protein IT384_10255 [Deltaproteobacteria bacterium]|nr:hypothetical protein [Deltaproteobacteria bacterium]